MTYDILVVGSGPAGLATGLAAGRRGLDVMLFESESIGGELVNRHSVANVPGVPDTTGPELRATMVEQLEQYSVPITLSTAEGIDVGDRFTVATPSDEYEADGDGTQGELAVRGPPVCPGYIDNAGANEMEFDDGWFHTGDILRCHPGSTYTYVNRRKSLIKSGGENVCPAEIEGILLEHDWADDAIVVRAPDETWGEVPRAVVGTSSPDEAPREELLAVCDDRLADYKQPYYLEFVVPEAFPRSSTGKIVHDDVEEWATDDDARVGEDKYE